MATGSEMTKVKYMIIGGLIGVATIVVVYQSLKIIKKRKEA
jgi:predicted small secreted protein